MSQPARVLGRGLQDCMLGGDLEFYDEEDGGTHRFLSFPEFQAAFRHPRTGEVQDRRSAG